MEPLAGTRGSVTKHLSVGTEEGLVVFDDRSCRMTVSTAFACEFRPKNL